MKSFLLLFIIILSSNAFKFNYNFKLSRSLNCNYLSPNEYNWNDIFRYNKNNNYKGILCIWKTNNWTNYQNNANKILKTLNKYRYTNNENIVNKKLYLKNEKLLFYKTTIFDKYNNTHLHLNHNEFRINLNVPEKNNTKLLYDININHPYNNDSLFNLKLLYFSENKTLRQISLERMDKYDDFYWNKNDIAINHKETFNTSAYLFGRNYNIKYPLKYSKYKNKLTLFDIKYPYLYDYFRNYNDFNLYNNILLNLPDNIKVYIPKKINFKEYYKISIIWQFKNEFKYNIFDINYNKTNYNFNLFNYI